MKHFSRNARAKGDFRAYYFWQRKCGFEDIRRRAAKSLGYMPDVAHPRTFNEKVLHRLVYSRDPLLLEVADKISARNYVRQKDNTGCVELIPVVAVLSDPEDIPLSLPPEFVLKPGWGSSLNCIVKGGDYNRSEIKEFVRRRMSAPYDVSRLNWAAEQAPRRVLIEKLLRDDDGNIPKDIKFHVFSGAVKYIQVYHNKTETASGHGPGTCSVFDGAFRRAEFSWGRPSGSMREIPSYVRDMCDAAEVLARDFDYMRVDLYFMKGKVYFGELTPFHMSGMGAFNPMKYDRVVGDLWSYDPDTSSLTL